MRFPVLFLVRLSSRCTVAHSTLSRRCRPRGCGAGCCQLARHMPDEQEESVGATDAHQRRELLEHEGFC